MCCLGFSLSCFYRASAAVIAPQLSQDLGLSPSDLGVVSAAFFYAFAVVQIPLGLVLDRLGSRGPVSLLMILGAAGAVVFASAQGMAQAVTGRVLLGVGMSAAMMGPFTLLASWFPPNRFASMAGVLLAVGLSGQMMAATPLALMAQYLGWRNAFLAIAVGNLLQALAFFLVVRDRPAGVPKPPPGPAGPLKGITWLLRQYSFWAIGLNGLFRYGAYMALAGLWAGPFMMNALGYSQVATGNALLGLNLGFLVSPLILGRLSDEWLTSRKKVILPTIPISILLVLSLGLWPRGFSQMWGWLIFFLIGFFSGSGTILFAQMKELTPAHLRATAFTGVNLFIIIGPAVIIQAAGLLVPGDPAGLADPANFVSVWNFMAAGMALAGILYVFCPDSRVAGEPSAAGSGPKERVSGH